MVGCKISPSPDSTHGHQRKCIIFLFWKSSQFCTKSLICPKGEKLLSLAQAPVEQRRWDVSGSRADSSLAQGAGTAGVGHGSASHSDFGKSHSVIRRQPYKQKEKPEENILSLSWTVQPSANSSLLLCWFSRKITLTVIFTCSFYHALSVSHRLICL